MRTSFARLRRIDESARSLNPTQVRDAIIRADPQRYVVEHVHASAGESGWDLVLFLRADEQEAADSVAAEIVARAISTEPLLNGYSIERAE